MITNDGSSDDTLAKLIEAFDLELARIPYRPDIPTAAVKAIYRGKGAVEITVVDKENGGKADALNAGINAARYPYVLCTDADVILDANCLVRSMQRVVEDRDRVIAVGGNIRPLNGSRVELGHLIESQVPRGMIARMQILEYLRTFISARPAWSAVNALPNVSGAFGVWKRTAVMDVGGFSGGHFGEDMDLTIRLHKHHLENEIPYRIVYEPSAVIWTEVPPTRRVLRRQRIRWHRGLIETVKDFLPITFNPRYGRLGTVVWPGYVLFEFLAPIVEMIGYVVVPLGLRPRRPPSRGHRHDDRRGVRGRDPQLTARDPARRALRLLQPRERHRPSGGDGAGGAVRVPPDDRPLAGPGDVRGAQRSQLGEHGAEGCGQSRRGLSLGPASPRAPRGSWASRL